MTAQGQGYEKFGYRGESACLVQVDITISRRSGRGRWRRVNKCRVLKCLVEKFADLVLSFVGLYPFNSRGPYEQNIHFSAKRFMA